MKKYNIIVDPVAETQMVEIETPIEKTTQPVE